MDLITGFAIPMIMLIIGMSLVISLVIALIIRIFFEPNTEHLYKKTFIVVLISIIIFAIYRGGNEIKDLSQINNIKNFNKVIYGKECNCDDSSIIKLSKLTKKSREEAFVLLKDIMEDNKITRYEYLQIEMFITKKNKRIEAGLEEEKSKIKEDEIKKEYDLLKLEYKNFNEGVITENNLLKLELDKLEKTLKELTK